MNGECLVIALVRLVLMEGDGIGPEITAATIGVLRAADRVLGLRLSFTPVAIGFAALRAHGTTLPEAAVDVAKGADGVILGPVSHNDYPLVAQGGLNPSGELRKRLDLYANIRPAKSRGGFPPRCGSPVDLVDRAREHRRLLRRPQHGRRLRRIHADTDLALAVRKITRAGSTRIAEAAFALAARRRGKVTAVHKANVLRVSDGLFLECVRARRPLSRRAIRGAHHGRHGGAAGARRRRLRRGRRHQHVRRHSLRPRRGDQRQPRARGLLERRQRACAGAGPARLGADLAGRTAPIRPR